MNRKLLIWAFVVTVVFAVCIGSASGATDVADNSPTPEITADPVVATGLVYENRAFPLLTNDRGAVSPSNALMEFSLSLNGPWYHTQNDITEHIVGKNAGNYEVYYRAAVLSADGDTYSPVRSKTVTIAKAAYTITLSAVSDSKTFGSSDPALRISFSGTTYNNEMLDISDYKAVRTPGESVGNYTIQIRKIATSDSNPAADNYPLILENGVFTIQPLNLTDVTVGDIAPQVYTGSPIRPSVTVSCSQPLNTGTDYVVSYENNTNVGTATLILSAKEGSNYTFDPMRVPFQILKANQANAAVAMNDYTVGSTPSVPEVRNAKESPVTTYYYTADSTATGTRWDTANPPQLSVGTYYMYAHLASTDHYNESTTEKTQFKVLDYAPTLTITYAYADGTAAAQPYRQTYSVGETYAVESPEIMNTQPSPAVVSGTMGTQDVQQNVVYTSYTPTSGDSTVISSSGNDKEGPSILTEIYEGTYAGDTAYEFYYGSDCIVTRLVLPAGSDITETVKWWENTDSKPAGCWYRFEVLAPGFAEGKTGTIYFRIPTSVIASNKITGDGYYDVSLYHNGLKLPTYFDSKDAAYAYYHSAVTSSGVFDLVFAANATQNAESVTSAQSTLSAAPTSASPTSASPAPLAGLIVGLGAAALVLARLRR